MKPIKNKHLNYKQCVRCVMDTSAKDIIFNQLGICNFCDEYQKNYTSFLNEHKNSKEYKLNDLIEKVKNSGKNKKYDCIVGLSGGVDSSWVLVQVINNGLKPLAVHMDNGWNSELAQNNIANLVRKLDVDLYTHVVNWNEYRGLMQTFFDSNVIDIELLYDNAMFAVNYSLAKKYGIKYILSGTNAATEGMNMPEGWNWFKFDKKNIYAISKQFRGPKIKSLPTIGVYDYLVYRYILKIKWISFLDFTEYNKEKAIICLEKDFQFKRYPFKHYESIFTRFYQGYILPNKFNVDKRLLHYSTLIMSKQLDRSQALNLLKNIPYDSMDKLNEDTTFFLKKMNWTKEMLDNYLGKSEVLHNTYATEKPTWDFFINLRKKFNHLIKIHS